MRSVHGSLCLARLADMQHLLFIALSSPPNQGFQGHCIDGAGDASQVCRAVNVTICTKCITGSECSIARSKLCKPLDRLIAVTANFVP